MATAVRRPRISAALAAALDRLSALHPKKIDLSLGRIERLLEALGRPQDRLAPVIHVAGTNGKGSTIAFLKAMIEADGKSAHVYTSPHLIRFNERIALNGAPMADCDLARLLDRVETANAGQPITFFEITTAAALLAFSETPADYCLIEVGLGGRYDATNVINAPACAVITPVGYDHKEFLGDDLAKIAWEKAGILKTERPAIIAPQDPEARAAIIAEAHHVGADAKVWGTDFRAYPDAGRLAVETENAVLDLPAPGLHGSHQVINAGLAAAVALSLGLSDAAIGEGMARARWPGRLHPITTGPLAEAARREGAEVWVDGAHNAMAAGALARALADLNDAAPRPIVLAIAMQKNKDLTAFLEPFAGLVNAVLAFPLRSGAPYWDEDDVAMQAAEVADTQAASLDDLHDLVPMACRLCTEAEPPRIVITGSLHFVGEALGLSEGAAPRATPG